MSLLFLLFFELTARQQYKVQTVIDKCDYFLALPVEKQDEYADGFGVQRNRFLNYVANVKQKAEEVQATGAWPTELADKPLSDIYDYLKGSAGQ